MPGEGLALERSEWHLEKGSAHNAHKCFGTDSGIPYPFAFLNCSQGKACLGAYGQQSAHFLNQSSGKHQVTEYLPGQLNQLQMLSLVTGCYREIGVYIQTYDMENIWDRCSRCVCRQSHFSLSSLVFPDGQTRISGSGCVSP